MSKLQSNYYFKRERIGLAVVGGVMALMVAFSLTPTFAGIVATITNDLNTVATGTLKMEEAKKGQAASPDCITEGTGSATCSSINKYGGQALAPGGKSTTEITITNKGSLTAKTFTVAGGACTVTNAPGAAVSGAGDLCEKIKVTISETGGPQIYQGTAKAFAAAGAKNIKSNVAANQVTNLTIVAELPNTDDVNAAFQGRQISQPITWQFNA